MRRITLLVVISLLMLFGLGVITGLEYALAAISSHWGPAPTLDQCAGCHSLHGGSQAQLVAGGASTTEALCMTCHGPGGVSVLKAEIHNNTTAKYAAFSITCTECHSSHDNPINWDSGMNLKLVGMNTTDYGRPMYSSGINNALINTPNNGFANVTFESRGTDVGGTLYNSFADADSDGDGKYDGVCEVCHTQTANHRNNSTGNHAHYTGTTCTLCHSHAKGFKGEGDCYICHTEAVASPNAEALDASVITRRAVIGEFGMSWSHKSSGAGAVTSNDCGVCHMEGNASDGSFNSTYHANGYVELRDPDTGLTIKQVVWSGPNAGGYASTGTDAAFVRFSRDLSSSTLETAVTAIQMNQCLKCHDTDGALDTSARVPGGTATDPFNTTATIVNVNEHFNTGNSSYHPVKGKQNNTYADNDRMKAPWNGINKTEGTLGADSWGYLISCWDCHAPDGTASTETLINTVTAHGGADTLRGTAWVTGDPSTTNRVTLCVICHAGYDTSGITPGHDIGSAAGDLKRVQKDDVMRYGCFYCHSSGDTAVRPQRAEDVHGFSAVWPATTRPQVAFIRPNDHITLHMPLSISGTAYTPQCTGMAGGLCGAGSGPGTRNEVYTGANGPGGVY